MNSSIGTVPPTTGTSSPIVEFTFGKMKKVWAKSISKIKPRGIKIARDHQKDLF